MGVVLVLSPVGAAPAQAADDGRTTTMASPGSQLDGMFVTYVGCGSMAAAAAAPATRINRGPLEAPSGRRSFGLVPPAPGTASGPTLSFLSLGSVDASVEVHAGDGTTGASYIWVSTADVPAGHAWHGRADLTVPAGAWQHVDTATTTHEWSLVDLVSGAVSAHESGTPAELVAAHGDGPGHVVTGFGCDGQAFNIDAVRGNGATWDFEGMSLTTAIASSSAEVAPGEPVSLVGRVTDPALRPTGDPLVLQSRAPGATEWTEVSELTHAGPDGSSHVLTTLEETSELRWLRPASEYADEGASEPVLVTVAAP